MREQIRSLHHPLIKHLVKLRQNTDYRYEHESVIIEGIKLAKEIGSSSHVKTLVVSDESLIPQGIKADQCYLVSEEAMKKASGMKSPEGILLEISMPKQADLSKKKRIIAIDKINDPGNLGTLLRTALALGWDGAFILNESCDPYNEKAIHAAMGATFRLPIFQGSFNDLKSLVEMESLDPLVADLSGTSCDEVKARNGILLVLSNEANGPSEEVKSLCKPVTIPMTGKMESLNVSIAGGILMYQLQSKT